MKKNIKKAWNILLVLCVAFTLLPMGAFAAGADNIVQIARGEVGTSGRPNKYTYWNGTIGNTYSYPWCAAFVSWCASQAGESTAIPKTASVENMANGILKAGGQRVSSPQAGDIVVYRRRSDGFYAHIGIMENSSSSIEGNYSNSVRRGINPHAYSCGGSSVRSGGIELIYLRPNYKSTSSGVTVRSHFACNVKITTTTGQRVNLFTNPTDSSPRTYFSRGQSANSTRGATLSNGTTWYQIQAMSGSKELTLWLNGASGGISITNYDSGTSNTVAVRSYFDCNTKITTTKGLRVNLFTNPTDSTPKTYFSQGQTASSTRGATLSNGTTWYEIQAMENGKVTTLWLNAASRGVRISDEPSPAQQTPANLGNDFYAYIGNTSLHRYVTNDPGGNVTSRSKYSASSQDMWRQVWHFERRSNGAYQISSSYNNYCLDVQEFGKNSGTNVRTYQSNGCTAQQWYIYKENGDYYLRAACTECVLDISGNSDTNGTNIQMWENNGTGAQRFSIEKMDVAEKTTPTNQRPADLGSDFYAYIVNTDLQRYVTNDPDGNVTSRSKNNTSSRDSQRQIWRFSRLSNGAYRISSSDNNNCLDIEEFGMTSGTNVRAYLDNGCSAQQWYIYEDGGSYRLRGACTECVLDVSGNSDTDGTNIQMWESNGTGAQRFSIEKVNAAHGT